jgi:hypothetical protein
MLELKTGLAIPREVMHSGSYVIEGDSKGASISRLAITTGDLLSYIYVFGMRTHGCRRQRRMCRWADA